MDFGWLDADSLDNLSWDDRIDDTGVNLWKGNDVKMKASQWKKIPWSILSPIDIPLTYAQGHHTGMERLEWTFDVKNKINKTLTLRHVLVVPVLYNLVSYSFFKARLRL